MALHDYFAPVERLTSKGAVTLQENIRPLDKETQIADYSVVLIGLPDGLSASLRPAHRGADRIRKKLYNLAAFDANFQILDAGNLRLANMPAEKAAKLLAEIVGDLLQNPRFILLFGGEENEWSQFMAYEELQRPITMLSVDNRINFSYPKGSAHGTQLDKIFSHHPNYLFHYIHLAYQSYLVNRETFSSLEDMHFEPVRLGTIRESLRECEALIRQADLLSFDTAALSKCYAPGGIGAEIFGLSGEEACQMAWYGGGSSQLSSAGIYGYHPADDDVQQTTAMTLATMLWYFIDGFRTRKHTFEFDEKEYVKYLVEPDGEDQHFVFYKSIFTEKWWMAIPFGKEKWMKNAFVPCSFGDYLQATKGEIPPRWLLMYNKMN